MRIPHLFALLATLSLAGCFEEEVKSIQYYKDNSVERAERMQKCELLHNAEEDGNCRNAVEAASAVQIEKSRESWKSLIPKN